MADLTIPITAVKADQKSAIVMAAAEIERFLATFYPIQTIRSLKSADIIAGMWVSRLKGLHESDDFLHLTRDLLNYVLSGGNRSRASDHIGFTFSGFMSSYGAARTFLGIVTDGGKWPDVRAFMHSQAYGNAQRYVEDFDWSAGEQKAHAETGAWLNILSDQEKKLSAAASGALGLVAPRAEWLGDAVKSAATAAEVQVEKSALKLMIDAAMKSPVTLGVVLLAYPSSLNDGEDAELQKIRQRQEELANGGKLGIPAPQVKTKAIVNTTNAECKPQTEINKQNGAKCENDGYTLMEKVLGYQRLVDPPKGRGLDGLFEKPAGMMSSPNPMPENVSQPRPGGKLVFIPEDKKPPKPQYPQFVVFEAKHISKGFGSGDTNGIQKEAKRRLGETCDGTQMSEPWTERRIPQALNRGVKDGKLTPAKREAKEETIDLNGYARWIFICLPGPSGSSSKLFVLIDVVGSGMDLEKPSQSSPHPESDTSGSFE